MSDYVVMVKQQAQVYLAGPPLVKMAIGEDNTHEELGGAEMHSRVSGVSDYLAAGRARRDPASVARSSRTSTGARAGAAPRAVTPPLYDADDLLGIASPDIKVPFDAREVIARVVDGSRFSEFKPPYGSTLVCGWAHVHGMPGRASSRTTASCSASRRRRARSSSSCATRPTCRSCSCRTSPASWSAGRCEQEGIIKHGAKLINAVSNSTVPAITIMIGARYGAGNYGMMRPRVRAALPVHVAESPHRGDGRQAARRRARHHPARVGGRSAARPSTSRSSRVCKAMIEQQIDKESDPYFATARLWDDGIIDPRDTRTVIAIALSAAYSAPVRGTTSWGVFRM